MILIKTAEEIELMRESNVLVSKTLAELAKHIRPGVSTERLDQIAETFIRDHRAVPGFLGYQGYPKTLCTSVNSEVVHGIPSAKVILKDGDQLSVDCGVVLNGFYGDTAFSFEVGEVSAEVRRLLNTTRECLQKGVEQAVEHVAARDPREEDDDLFGIHRQSVLEQLADSAGDLPFFFEGKSADVPDIDCRRVIAALAGAVVGVGFDEGHVQTSLLFVQSLQQDCRDP